MKNYLITFYYRSDTNDRISVEIRTKLENLSDLWVQVFPNQLSVKSTMSSKEIYEYLLPLSEDVRISIVQFNDYFVNEDRFNRKLQEHDY